jgi:cold-inducible RNA-binding protein
MRNARTHVGRGQGLRKAAVDCTGIPGGRQVHSGDSRVGVCAARYEFALVRRVLEYERPVGPPRLFCLRLRCCTLQNRKPAAPTFLKDRAMKIYVGNLSFNTADQELTALFTPYGQVDSVRLIRDRATGQSRGFGFVEMADASAGRAACTALDQQEFEGRRLTVNEAKPQEQRSGGGGGGFGRGRDARW